MHVGKWLILGGIALVIVGLLLWWKVPLARLPGDIHIKGKKVQVYIPIVTSIVISVVLTLVLNFVLWLMRK